VPGPNAFGRERRLLDKSQFDPVFAAPEVRLRRHPFLLLARRRPDGPSRLGMVVGKRNARRAVDRNRIRRLTREAFRIRRLEPAMDVIVMARGGAADATRDDLTAALAWLMDRLGRDASRLDGAATEPRA
jgi:ribonuclease P protein component